MRCQRVLCRRYKIRTKVRRLRLDYSRFNVGDGPAAFLTLIIGAITVASPSGSK